MPIEHVIYIPAVLILGLVAGYVIGARAAREEADRQRKSARK